MRRLTVVISAVHHGEDGHTRTLPAYIISAAGMIVLGIGAANDTGWLAITGGIVGGLGLLAGAAITHQTIDYDIYDRLEKLEKK
jgi:hypothetical protein